MESLGEKAFEVSEMYIFGKSEAFCRRLEKVSILYAVIIGKEEASLQRIVYRVDACQHIHALNHPVKEFVTLCWEKLGTSTE